MKLDGTVSPARDQSSSKLRSPSADEDNVVSDTDSQDDASSETGKGTMDDLSAHDLEFISSTLLEALVPDESLFLPQVDPYPAEAV